MTSGRKWLFAICCLMIVFCLFQDIEGSSDGNKCSNKCRSQCKQSHKGHKKSNGKCEKKCSKLSTCEVCDSRQKCSKCKEGFYFSKSSACIKKQKEEVVDCSMRNGGCSLNANCTMVNGKINCTCKRGYYGNGRECKKFECSECNGGCSINATCTMVNGTVNCACKTGYVGDGYTCKKLDCSINNGGCSPDALCAMDNENVTCACKTGYFGDGYTCNGCPPGYTFRAPGGSCYKFDGSTPNTRAEAQAACNTDGAHLVWIETQAEDDDITALVANVQVIWIGGCRLTADVPGTFVWTHDCTGIGQTSGATKNFAYTRWNSLIIQQPDNLNGNEACVTDAIIYNGWIDSECIGPLPGQVFPAYVCEFDGN